MKWTSELKLKRNCAIDPRAEAVKYYSHKKWKDFSFCFLWLWKYDENTIGVYLWGKEGRGAGLVGHLPMKIPKLTNQFLNPDKNNVMIDVTVMIDDKNVTFFGKWKNKFGLVITAKSIANLTPCAFLLVAAIVFIDFVVFRDQLIAHSGYLYTPCADQVY